MKVRCHFCEREVDPDARSTYRQILGWEGRRKQGGTNHIPLRELTGEYAHQTCVERASRERRYHVTPGQMSFE